jgi:hypothetical protein
MLGGATVMRAVLVFWSRDSLLCPVTLF